MRVSSIVVLALVSCSEDSPSAQDTGAGNGVGATSATPTDAGSGSAPGAQGGGAQGGGVAIGGSGSGVSRIEGCQIFPSDNPWNQDVSALPVHPNSDAFVASMGGSDFVHPDFGTEWDGAPIGIPFVTVDAGEPRRPIEFMAYGDESDPGPYPIPLTAPVEGGAAAEGDRHVLAVDTEHCQLYELYRAFPQSDGSWQADSGAVFDLTRDDEHPMTWTSADAAGLPIFPGLVRYDEVAQRGELLHAVRFTASRTRRAVVAPARHYASSSDDPDLPPMGLRLRLRADYDCSSYSSEARVICAGLKRYGILLADNGSDWYLSGAPDPRWDDDALGDLKRIPGSAFEAVDTGPIQTY